jgi:hypothetical protein
MRRVLLCLAIIFASASTALAQWSNDYSVNNEIVPDTIENYGYEVKTNNNGITYVFFQVPMLNADGSDYISMRLQVLDKDGNKLLAGEGQEISGEANKTWTAVNDHLMIDNDGNAIITVIDKRTGNDGATAYKYGPDGKLIWGGVALGDGEPINLIACNRMACTTDGGYVFAYCAYPTDGSGYIVLEKLNKDGKKVWDNDVVKIIDSEGKVDYSYPYIVDAGDNQVMLVYAKGTNQDLMGRMIDFDGDRVWENDVTIYKGGFTSVPLWTMMSVQQAPNGGAFISWMDSRNQVNYENCISMIKNDGDYGFSTGEEGTIISNDEDNSRTLPSILYDKEDNVIYFAFEVFNQGSQGYQGVFMQKMSMDGELLWGSNGKAVCDMQSDYSYGNVTVQKAGTGRIGVFYQTLEGISSNSPVSSNVAIYDKDGNTIVPQMNFTTYSNNRSKLKVSPLIDGKYYLANWSENRNSSDSYTQAIYMQKVNLEDILATGINTLNNDNNNKKIVNQEIFNAAGQRVTSADKGVNIIKNTYDDNSTESYKVIK